MASRHLPPAQLVAMLKSAQHNVGVCIDEACESCQNPIREMDLLLAINELESQLHTMLAISASMKGCLTMNMLARERHGSN